MCGICGGDGSKCKTRRRKFDRRPTVKLGLSKLMLLPAGARNVKITFQSSENVSLTLKARCY